jgi:hypothetical protein
VQVQQEDAGQTTVIEGQLPYLAHFYTFIEGDIAVDDLPARIKIPHDQMMVAAWSLPESKQICQFNVGSTEKPQYLKISAHLDRRHATEAEQLFREFKDVFAWSYKDLKGIPPTLAEHKIELEKDVLTAHKARYRMNPNYASIVKQDIDRLLEAGFIAHMEEASWLSPIVIVPKKNAS